MLAVVLSPFAIWRAIRIRCSRAAAASPIPKNDLQARAEVLLLRLLPAAVFDKTSGCDVREVARSVIVRSSEVSAHRRLELLGRYGRSLVEG